MRKKTDMQGIYTRIIIKESVFGKKTKHAYHSGIAKAVVLPCIPALLHFSFITILLMAFGCDHAAVETDMALSLLFSAVLSAYLAARLKRKRDGLISWLAAFPAEAFQILCGEAELAGEKYRCLYLLDDYLYIHTNMLMIRYDEIDEFYARFRYEGHLTVKRCSKAVLGIKLAGGRRLKINIDNYSLFEKEYKAFERGLADKIKRRGHNLIFVFRPERTEHKKTAINTDGRIL